MEQSKRQKNTGYYVRSAIMLCIMFGFGFLPPIEPLTPLSMRVLGIFISLLFAWTCVDFIWPSLLGMLALGMTDYTTVNNVLKAGFGNDIVLLIFFVFVLSTYLDRVGLTQYIADWFISRKAAVGRPWVFTLMIFLTAYVLGVFISLTATIIIVWTIFYKIIDTVGFKKTDRYVPLVMIGIVYAGMLGYALLPFKLIQAQILGVVYQCTGLTIDFLTFTGSTLILTLACLLVFLLFCKFVLRPNVAVLQQGVDYFAHLRDKKMDADQKIAAAALLGYMLLMVLPDLLPKIPLLMAIKGLGMTGALILVLVLLCAVRLKNGDRLLDFAVMANHNVAWDIIILLASTMPLSQAISSPELHIMELVERSLDPIFQGMGPITFTIIFVALAAFITQIVHNLVLGAVMVPILCNLALGMGLNPMAVVIPFSLAINIANVTPAASSAGALPFANTAWIARRDAYLYSFICFAVNLVVMLTLGTLLGNLFVK